MKTRKLLTVLLGACALTSISGCSMLESLLTPNTSSNSSTSTSGVTDQETIYNLAVKAGYSGTYEEWLNSIRGEDGTMWYTGEENPSLTLSTKNGDLYLNTTTCDIYKRVNSGWTKIANIKGADGGPIGSGNAWHTGEGIPSESLSANEGDLYLDTNNCDVYKLTSQGWKVIVNIKTVVEPSEEDYKKWAEENGYTQAQDYEDWAKENGYTKLEALPTPRLEGKTSYVNTDSSIQINPSEKGQVPLIDYLKRPDVRYIDLRGVDEGYVIGHIEGFESISYFKIIANINNDGQSLYTATSHNMEATFTANYEESDYILEKLFPKGKTMFIMCQSGGRVVPFMRLLESRGYDMNKIYNVGGWGQVSRSGYDYPISTSEIRATVDYDFSMLTPINN